MCKVPRVIHATSEVNFYPGRVRCKVMRLQYFKQVGIEKTRAIFCLSVALLSRHFDVYLPMPRSPVQPNDRRRRARAVVARRNEKHYN